MSSHAEFEEFYGGAVGRLLGQLVLVTGDLHEILKRVFGFDEFRGVQEQVIDRVMRGEPTLAVMDVDELCAGPANGFRCAQYPAPLTIPPRSSRSFCSFR